jgi:hypothetical protein
MIILSQTSELDSLKKRTKITLIQETKIPIQLVGYGFNQTKASTFK